MALDDIVKKYLYDKLSDREWLDYFVNKVIRVNEIIVNKADPPEDHIVLDRSKLESALAQVYYCDEDPTRAAAVVLKGIIGAHAFFQGNHRTALITAQMFLGRKVRLSYYQLKKSKKWSIEKLIKLI